jgi:hypothetical protein
MWPARSAIRPTPPHAVVPRDAIERVEAEFDEADDLEARIHVALRELDRVQPTLAGWLRTEFDGLTDDTALALGQFLGVSVHRAFVEAFGQRLRSVDEGVLDATRATFDYDEELRRGAVDEMLESDDLVAIGQPHLMAFVREQVEASLEPDEDGDPSDVDIEAVAEIYKVILIEILALGQAVVPPRGIPSSSGVLM